MTQPGPAASVPEPGPELDGPPEDTVSLGQRLRQPRTIVSLILPLVIVVLVARVAANIDFGQLVDGVAKSNKLLLLAGFVVFYIGFPLRGYRWKRLLQGSGFRIATTDATEVLFLSWLVNCLVPAKLGDVYRAYLLKINSPASLSRTFGSVVIERFLDLFVIAATGLAAGFWSFRNGFPTAMQWIVALGIGVIIALAVLLLLLRNWGRSMLVRFHVPHRFIELYDKFEEGVFGAIGLRSLPGLVVLTGLIWATEGFRLWFVVQALALPGVDLGLSGAFFVALIGSLLTAVPLSPAGLGTVELGVGGVLHLAYGIATTAAATVILVDRMISVFSIIVLGGILYVVSGKRRGAGLAPGSGPVDEAPAPA